MDPEHKKKLKYALIFLFCSIMLYYVYNNYSSLQQTGGALPDQNLIRITECNKIIESLLQ